MPVYFLEIIVVSLGIIMLLVDAFVKLEDKRSIAWIGMLGLVATFGLLFRVQWSESTESPFWNFYTTGDQMALYFKGIAILTTLVVLIMASDYSRIVVDQTAPPEKGAHPQSGLGEFFALPMFACAGLMLMASANHLVSIFVALETVTIAFYVMVAYLRRNVGSLEAGVKYLILGALSSGFLVYGFAWLYGMTGSMQLEEIKTALSGDNVNVIGSLFAFSLILVALAFKVGGAPFHFWIPDVYQGAPTPITAFLSVGSKAAGFIVLLRLIDPFLSSSELVGKIILAVTVIAVLTLIVGNLSALPQQNFKRLLAYSSVAHAGFLLMALACTPTASQAGEFLSPAKVIAFYLGAYLLMTLLAFLVMTTVRVQIPGEDLTSYKGLAKRSPFLAFAMIISMASLAGIPLTAGFFGKFFVFQLAVQQQQWFLLTVGLVGAGAGFYYYLKIAASMFLSEQDPKDDISAIPVGTLSRIAMIVLIALILIGGLNPALIIGLLS